MDTSTTDISAADLLRHASWLRRLLASLLADDRIDDAVQHTWLAALRRMPRNVGSLRSWLGAVARNSARDALRDRRRRREQELADRVDPQTPTPPAALERLEVTQAVVAAVRSLPEPYRGTVVRRYYSGQSIAEIATAMATTPANVRQRLSRGIAMLRQHLADRLGTDWRASLTMLALAGGSAAARPAAIAAIAVLLLGSAALALGMAWSTPPASPQADAATAVLVGTPPVAVQPAAGIGDGAPSLPRGHERVLVPSPAPPQPLRGRVVDPTGVPLGGVPVGTDRREPDNPDLDRVANPIDRPLTGPGAFEVLATSGADGSFAIGEPPVWSSLFSGGDFAPIVSFGIAPPLCQAQDVLIVATRAVSIAGRVVDDDGQPRAGVPIDGTLAPLLDLELDWQRGMPIQYRPVRSAADGTFRLDGLPAGRMRLAFGKIGGAIVERDVPEHSADDWTIVLGDAEVPCLIGTVLDPHGRPVPGALVGVGTQVAFAGNDGRYRVLLYRPLADDSQRYALAAGWQPVVAAHPATTAPADETVWNPVLEQRAATLAGRVTDADGNAVPDLRVTLWDPTPLGDGVQAERARIGPSGDHDSYGWLETATDADGRFALEQLADRPYRLVLIGGDGRDLVRTEPLQPGPTPCELHWLPAQERVPGVVRDGSGRPALGTRLSLTRYLTASGPRVVQWALDEPDADGRFVCPAPPSWSRPELIVSGDGWAMTVAPWARIHSAGGLRVAAFRECTFRLELRGANAAATGFRLLDGEGSAIEIVCWRGFGGVSSDEFGVEDGRTEVLTAGEQARTLLLLRDGAELARLPVRLTPGGVQTLRF